MACVYYSKTGRKEGRYNMAEMSYRSRANDKRRYSKLPPFEKSDGDESVANYGRIMNGWRIVEYRWRNGWDV